MNFVFLLFSLTSLGIVTGNFFLDDPLEKKTLGSSSLDHFIINIDDTIGVKDEEVCLGFVTRGFTNILGLQFSINFDPGHLSFQKVEVEGMPGLTASNFAVTGSDNGILTFFWIAPDVQPVDLPDFTNLFSVCFKAIGEINSNSSVEITGNPTPIEVFKGDGPVFDYEWGNGVVLIRENTCRARDSLILVDLYLNTTGLFWRNSWDLRQPMDTWHGVTLDQDGCVSCLDLDGEDDCTYAVSPGGNGLIGILPNSLGGLSSLKDLFLTDNKGIKGSFPASIFTIQSLERIAIDNCSFSEKVDTAVTSMPNLELFLLDNNKFTFEDIIDIVPFLETISYDYASQDSVLNDTVINILEESAFIYFFNLDNTISTNKYDWYKDGSLILANSPVNTFIRPNVSQSSSGMYSFIAKNDGAPELFLPSRKITLNVQPGSFLSNPLFVYTQCTHPFESSNFFIDVKVVNPPSDSFIIKLDQAIVGVFNYDDLPVNIGNYYDVGGKSYQIELIDKIESGFSISFLGGPITCNNSCSFNFDVFTEDEICWSQNGSVDIIFQEDTVGLSVIWEDGIKSFNRNDLVAGMYTVTISDEECQQIFPIRVGFDEPPKLITNKNFGGSKRDEPSAMILTNDGHFIIAGGTFSADSNFQINRGEQDFFIMKIDTIGNILWSKTYGGTERDIGTDIIETPEGDLLIVGYTESDDGDINLNKGGRDILVLKLNENGDLIWSKTYGGSANDEAYQIEMAANGNYFVGGLSHSNDGDLKENYGSSDLWFFQIDKNGAMLWEQNYGGSSQEVFGDFYATTGRLNILASTRSEDIDVELNNGGYDVWFFSTRYDGGIVTNINIGGTANDYGRKLIHDGNGNHYIIGDTGSSDGDLNFLRGIFDIMVAKVRSGEKIWVKNYGGTQLEFGRTGILKPNGNLFIGGSTFSNDFDVPKSEVGLDAWIFEINELGELLFNETYGGSGSESVFDVEITQNGTFGFLGTTTSDEDSIWNNFGLQDILFLTLDQKEEWSYNVEIPSIICQNQLTVAEVASENCSDCVIRWSDQDSSFIKEFLPIFDTILQFEISDEDGCKLMGEALIEPFGTQDITLFDDYVFISNNENFHTFNLVSNDLINQNFKAASIGILNVDFDITQDGSLEYTRSQATSQNSIILTYQVCLLDCPDICDSANIEVNFTKDCFTTAQSNIPNLITPDGNGANDIFDPIGIFETYGCDISIENSMIQIFTRNGEQVFFREPYEAWNGMNLQGQALPQSTYYYVLKIQTPEGIETLNGPINLIKQ
jgi:gliding motility-associated-like protein